MDEAHKVMNDQKKRSRSRSREGVPRVIVVPDLPTAIANYREMSIEKLQRAVAVARAIGAPPFNVERTVPLGAPPPGLSHPNRPGHPN